MATGRVFSGTRPAPSLMERSLNLINGFGTSMRFFFKTLSGFGYYPTPPHPTPPYPVPFTYKINFKIKFNLKFKINLI